MKSNVKLAKLFTSRQTYPFFVVFLKRPKKYNNEIPRKDFSNDVPMDDFIFHKNRGWAVLAHRPATRLQAAKI